MVDYPVDTACLLVSYTQCHQLKAVRLTELQFSQRIKTRHRHEFYSHDGFQEGKT